MLRIYRLQGIVVILFAPIVVSLVLSQSVHDGLMLLGAGVALVHIASYAPRAALRAAGDARFESITKVIERLVTTVGYASLHFIHSSDVVAYAAVFLGGAIVGFILALVGAYWTCAKTSGNAKSSQLGSD